MKRVLLLSILLAIKSSAIGAAESPPSWSLIIRYDSGNETYYDTIARTYKGVVVVRFLRNLAGGGSWLTDVAVDCPTRTATALRQVQYKGQMGSGEQLDSVVVDERVWKNNPWPPWDKFVFPAEIGFARLAAEACKVSPSNTANSSAPTGLSLEGWQKQGYEFKVNLIKGLIEFAKKQNIILRLSPEYYVTEIDTLITNTIRNGNQAALADPVGVSWKTIAMMDCDWDSGKDRLQEARAFFGEGIFDFYRKTYPAKYEKLRAGCK